MSKIWDSLRQLSQPKGTINAKATVCAYLDQPRCQGRSNAPWALARIMLAEQAREAFCLVGLVEH